MSGAKGGVRVTNMRVSMSPENQPEEHESVVVVDRTHPCLGNPHILYKKADLRAREQVIAAKARDLKHDLAVNGPMSRALHEIAARVRAGERICLACWCTPSPCHADLYVKVIREINAKLEKPNDQKRA